MDEKEIFAFQRAIGVSIGEIEKLKSKLSGSELVDSEAQLDTLKEILKRYERRAEIALSLKKIKAEITSPQELIDKLWKLNLIDPNESDYVETYQQWFYQPSIASEMFGHADAQVRTVLYHGIGNKGELIAAVEGGQVSDKRARLLSLAPAMLAVCRAILRAMPDTLTFLFPKVNAVLSEIVFGLDDIDITDL